MSFNNLLWKKYLFIKYPQNKKKQRNNKYLQLVDFWHLSSCPNNIGWMHNWVNKIPNLFDMLMKWTLKDTYGKLQPPITIFLEQLHPLNQHQFIVYYAFQSIPLLNPILTNSKLECNQFLIWLEQLHNLEQRPSHWSNFQHVEPWK
jgi:hypothetical protein